VISSLETQAEIHALRGAVRFPHRLAEVPVLVRVKRCVFPAPGMYQMNMLLDDEWLAH
jgi:hypothetical protein